MQSGFIAATGIFSAVMCVALAGAPAQASEFPSRAVRIVVPFAAAGTSDLVTRVLAPELSKAWNVPVVVDNKPGAGGNIGAESVAQSAPDGHTILMGTVATHGINTSLYKKMPFDPVKDFAPVSLVASTPSVLAVTPSLPVNSVSELISHARANPGKLFFGSPGNGSSHHLAGELFDSMAGIKMVHVPYRGTAAAITDLIGGRIQVIFDTLPSAMPYVKSAKMKALAVTSTARDPALPDLPTVAEAGLPGYEVGSWYGVLAPAGTPPEIVAKISAAIASVVQMPETRAKLLSYGAAPIGSTPEQFAQHIRREIDKWAVVIKASGAQVD